MVHKDRDTQFGYVVRNIPKNGYGGGMLLGTLVTMSGLLFQYDVLGVILIEHYVLILIERSPLSRLSLLDSLSSPSLSSLAF